MVERHESSLNIRAGTTSSQSSRAVSSNPSGVHTVEKQLLGGIGFGVMNKRDLAQQGTPALTSLERTSRRGKR